MRLGEAPTTGCKKVHEVAEEFTGFMHQPSIKPICILAPVSAPHHEILGTLEIGPPSLKPPHLVTSKHAFVGRVKLSPWTSSALMQNSAERCSSIRVFSI